MMLADLGAEVLVVRRPGAQPPEAVLHVAEVDPLERGKIEIRLDIKAAGDRDLLLEVIERSDVLPSRFVRGSWSVGLGPDIAHNVIPALCTSHGLGQDGPWPRRQAMTQITSQPRVCCSILDEPIPRPWCHPYRWQMPLGRSTLTAAISALVHAVRQGRGKS